MRRASFLRQMRAITAVQRQRYVPKLQRNPFPPTSNSSAGVIRRLNHSSDIQGHPTNHTNDQNDEVVKNQDASTTLRGITQLLSPKKARWTVEEWQQAQQYLQSMKEDVTTAEVATGLQILTRMLDEGGKHGPPPVLSNMQQLQLEPLVAAYTTVLEENASSKVLTPPKEVWNLIQRCMGYIRPPPPSFYEHWFHPSVLSQDPALGWHVYVFLLEQPRLYHPTEPMCRALLEAGLVVRRNTSYQEHAQATIQVVQTLEQFYQRHVKHRKAAAADAYCPTPHLYCAAMECLVQQGGNSSPAPLDNERQLLLQHLNQLYLDMKRSCDFDLDTVVYLRVIRAFCIADCPEQAESIFLLDAWRSWGHLSLADMVAELISTWVRLEHEDRAEQLLHQVIDMAHQKQPEPIYDDESNTPRRNLVQELLQMQSQWNAAMEMIAQQNEKERQEELARQKEEQERQRREAFKSPQVKFMEQLDALFEESPLYDDDDDDEAARHHEKNQEPILSFSQKPTGARPTRSNNTSSWVYDLLKDRLQSLGPGSLELQDWYNAQNYWHNLEVDDVGDFLQDNIWILDRLVLELQQHTDATSNNLSLPLLPYTSSLEKVLGAWKKLTTNQAVVYDLDPMALWDKVDRYVEWGLVSTPPITAYHEILQQLVKTRTTTSGEDQTLTRADERFAALLKRILETNHDPNSGCWPTEATIRYMIQLQHRRGGNGDDVSVQRAEHYFQILHSVQQRQRSAPQLEPTAELLCTMIEIHATNGSAVDMDRIQKLYQEMKQKTNELWTKSPNDDDQQQHDVLEYTARVIRTLSRCNHPLAVDQGRTMLEEFLSNPATKAMFDNNPRWKSTVERLTSGIVAAHGRRDAEQQRVLTAQNEQSVALLDMVAPKGDKQKLLEKYNNTHRPQKYNIAERPQKAPAVSSGATASQKNEKPQELEKYIQQILRDVASALEKSGNEGSDHLAQITEGFQKQFENLEKEHVSLRQDILNGLNGLLQYCTSGERWPTAKGARLAQLLLQWMETLPDSALQPNGESYIRLIQAWKNAKKPEKCEEVLERILKKVKEGTLVLGDDASRDNLPQMFNFVIRTWGESSRENSAEKAHELFQLMEAENVQPNDAVYHAVMNAFIRRFWPGTDVLELATAFYHEVKSREGVMRYDSFGAKLIEAWTRVGNGNPERVEPLFSEMKEDWKNGKTVYKEFMTDAYANCLKSWAKAGRPENALEVFDEWIELGDKLERKPTTTEFNYLLMAWVESDRQGESVKQAELGLRRMIKLAEAGDYNCYPNYSSFNLVLNALTKSQAIGAGEHALQIFRKMQFMAVSHPTVEPQLSTYVQVLVALIRFSRSYSTRAIEDLLTELQGKPLEFFQKDRHLMQRIENALKNNSVRNQPELLADFKRLHARVRTSPLNNPGVVVVPKKQHKRKNQL